MMILAFDFHYLSSNGVLESFLNNCVSETSLSYQLDREGNVVTLYVEGEEKALIDFSEKLSLELPLSLYFKSSTVRAVESMPTSVSTMRSCDLELPFTPRMLKHVMDRDGEDYYNPFITPDVGMASDVNAPLTLCVDDMKQEATNTFKPLFEAAAASLKEGKRLHVKTLTGTVTVGVLNETCADLLKENSFTVVPCDLSVAEKMVVIKDNEVKALASLEKPTLKLKVNMLYQAKNILPHAHVSMRLADDLILYLLCVELFALGIDFFYMTDEHLAADGRLSFTGNGAINRNEVGVVVLENGEILPLFGDAYASKSLKEGLGQFDAAYHARYAALMKEHKLFDKKSCCFYLSEKHDDKIMFYSEESGMIDLIGVDVPSSINAMLKRIEDSDETGGQLVANYRKAFPEISAVLDSIDVPSTLPKSLYTMFGIAGVIFGFSDDVAIAAAKLLENADAFGGTKGPRIDYRLLDESLRSNLDIAKLIRSGMSFRLAGTDDMTISFGYLESLSYFVSDMADSFKENLQSTHVGLCGSIFGFKKFSELTARNIQPNHTVCFNRELPMDA